MPKLQPESGHQRWDAVLERAAAALTRTFPHLETAFLLRKARLLGQARIPEIFARELRPLDASLNDSLLDLLARARQVAQNRFAFLNRPQTFGEHIPWEDVESSRWHAELHSFDYGLELAVAHRIFGEQPFAQHLRYLVANWIASNPPFEGPGWATWPLSRRIRNWILAADLVRSDWEADGQFFDIVSQSLALQAVRLSRQVNELHDQSEQAAAALALLLAARLFDGPCPHPLKSASWKLITSAGDDRDRAFADDDPASRLFKARTLIEYTLFCNPLDSDALPQLLRQAGAALAQVEAGLFPDGRLSMVGSRQPPSVEFLDDTLSLAAVVLGTTWCRTIVPDLGIFPYLLLGEEGRQRLKDLPSEPWEPASVWKPTGGLLRLVGPGSSAAIILAPSDSSRTKPHALPGYELMIRNQMVIVDSGCPSDTAAAGGCPPSEPLAHNVLLWEGQPAPFAFDDSTSVHSEMLSGRGYQGIALRIAPAAKRPWVYERAWYSLHDGSWLICDRLDGPPGGTLKTILHFYPTFELILEPSMVLARSHSLNLKLLPIGPPPARILSGGGDDPRLPGWYFPAPGVKYAAGAIAIEWETGGESWLGGYLITPQAALTPDSIRFEAGQGFLLLEMGKNAYRLPMDIFRERKSL